MTTPMISGAITVGTVRLRSGCRRAFTLIELMVVIAIAAIAAAMILPELRGTFEEALLRSTARQLTDACHAASSRAIARNQAHQLQLDTRTGRYVIASREADGATDLGNSGDRSRVEGQLDTRIAIEMGGADLESTDRTVETATPNEPFSGTRGAAGEARTEFDSPRDVFVFLPDGTASGPSIVLSDREGFRLAFVVHPITARVRLTELPRR